MLHSTGSLSESPLQIELRDAVREGDEAAVRSSVESGADVNRCDSSGCTAVHLAARHGRIDILRLLLELGGSVTAVSFDEGTPLRTAVMYRQLSTVQFLLGLFRNPVASQEELDKALFIAVTNGDAPTTRLLVENGADIYCKVDPHNSATALTHAARQGKDNIIRAMILNEGGIRAPAAGTRHAILEAARHPAAIRALVELGADLHATDQHGDTVMHKAVENWDMRAMSALFHGSRRTSIAAVAHAKKNEAEAARMLRCIETLVELGADINVQNGAGQTPLFLHCYSYALQPVVQRLLECGADYRFLDKEGRTPYSVTIADNLEAKLFLLRTATYDRRRGFLLFLARWGLLPRSSRQPAGGRSGSLAEMVLGMRDMQREIMSFL